MIVNKDGTIRNWNVGDKVKIVTNYRTIDGVVLEEQLDWALVQTARDIRWYHVSHFVMPKESTTIFYADGGDVP